MESGEFVWAHATIWCPEAPGPCGLGYMTITFFVACSTNIIQLQLSNFVHECVCRCDCRLLWPVTMLNCMQLRNFTSTVMAAS